MAVNADNATATTATGLGTRNFLRPETTGARAKVRSTAIASGMNTSRPKYSAATAAANAVKGG
jgi:hypothetical protein